MTHLISKIESIDRLTFEPIKSKVIKAVKAVCVDRTTVILGANGVIYVSGIRARMVYPFTTYPLANALTACIKLGILTDEAVAEHRAIEKDVDEKRERKYCAEAFASNAKSLGLKLTKAQETLIAKATAK